MTIKLLRTIFLTMVISLIGLQTSHACDCVYAGDFTEFSKGRTVIRGEIVSYGPKLSHGETLYATMVVSVKQVIKGSYAHRSVQFEGDPGNLCLTYVDSNQYSIGSEHLFILSSDEKTQGLLGCGEVSVAIVDGKVFSWELIDGEWKEYSVDYDDFIQAVKE